MVITYFQFKKNGDHILPRPYIINNFILFSCQLKIFVLSVGNASLYDNYVMLQQLPLRRKWSGIQVQCFCLSRKCVRRERSYIISHYNLVGRKGLFDSTVSSFAVGSNQSLCIKVRVKLPSIFPFLAPPPNGDSNWVGPYRFIE